MKKYLIGWELVGVLVGVSHFHTPWVGVFLMNGGSFRVFFLGGDSISSFRQQVTHSQGDIQIITETHAPDRRIILCPHCHRLGETLHSHS